MTVEKYKELLKLSKVEEIKEDYIVEIFKKICH